jgi:hypothetical protein
VCVARVFFVTGWIGAAAGVAALHSALPSYSVVLTPSDRPSSSLTPTVTVSTSLTAAAGSVVTVSTEDS